MKKLILTIFVLLPICNVHTQIQPSAYVGYGRPNLGGIVGAGGELRYNSISISSGIGYIPFGDNNLYLDCGFKFYTKQNIFFGVNYGIIRLSGSLLTNPKDVYGFSFSGGYRRTIYKHLFGAAFIGATSDYLAVNKNFDKNYILPCFGLIIGYDF